MCSAAGGDAVPAAALGVGHAHHSSRPCRSRAVQLVDAASRARVLARLPALRFAPADAQHRLLPPAVSRAGLLAVRSTAAAAAMSQQCRRRPHRASLSLRVAVARALTRGVHARPALQATRSSRYVPRGGSPMISTGISGVHQLGPNTEGTFHVSTFLHYMS